MFSLLGRLENPALAAPLFEGWEETLILSSLSGVMGIVYADLSESPLGSAMCFLGDFAFYAGEPSEKLLRFSPEGRPRFCILTPRDEKWSALIERVYGGSCEKQLRYAFHRSETHFDTEKLRQLAAALPEGYRITPMDGSLYRICLEAEWSRDFVSQFQDEADYLNRGLGMAVMHQEDLVGGASSYSVFPGGIEIEIDIAEDHRRKGLATACAAALILEALKRGLYPSWDAANAISVKLAHKLGYGTAREYPVYFTDRMGFPEGESNI